MESTNVTTNSQEVFSDSCTQFISFFNYSLLTLSVQPEVNSSITLPTTQFFSNKNRIRAIKLNEEPVCDGMSKDGVNGSGSGNGAGTASYIIDNLNTVIPSLQFMQRYNAAIYFTVNEGNGIPHSLSNDPNNLNCGKKSNITTLKALFIDTDDGDVKVLTERLKELNLLPHLIVESSPNKYHLYFLLEPVIIGGSDCVDKWIELQKFLASLVAGLDQSMTDINQVLRLPGFYHQKKDKFLVRLVKTYTHGRYDLFDLHEKLVGHSNNGADNSTSSPNLSQPINLTPSPDEYSGPDEYAGPSPDEYSGQNEYAGPSKVGYSSNHNNLNSKSYTPYSFPSQTITHPGRRKAITQYIEHILENILPLSAPEADYLVLIDAFIIKYIAEGTVFLDNGARRANILQYLRDRRTLRLNEKAKREYQQTTSTFNSVERHSKTSLPNSFYLNFPGPLGSITKELYSMTKLPVELCFAGAFILAGTLKAPTYRFKNSWPLVNGVIAAGTGAGKSTLLQVLRYVLKEAGVSSKYPQLIESQSTVQSLHAHMYAAGGIGTLFMDEAGDFMKGLKSNTAQNFTTALRQYFKNATTGLASGSTITPGGSINFKLGPIYDGFLSIWMCLQPSIFHDAFTSTDIDDGFLPRFLFFRADGDVRTFFSDTKRFEPYMSLELQSTLLSFNYSNLSDNALDAILADLKGGLASGAQGGSKKGVTADDRLQAIYDAKAQHRRMIEQVEVTFADAESAGVYKKYLQDWEQETTNIHSNNKDDPKLMFLIRLREMFNRLLCAASHSDGSLTKDIIESIGTFQTMCMNRFFNEDMPLLGVNKKRNEVLKAVQKALMASGGIPVTAKEIHNKISSNRYKTQLASTLQELCQTGELWIEQRSHKQSSEKKVTVYRLSVKED